MNKNPISAIGGISLLAALIVAILLTAQEGLAQVSSKHHTRYKVIDTGTFGGPNGHMSLGAHILNNNGTFTGFADTSTPDPYAPDGCWDGDCLVAHTFKWRKGELTDLGVLAGGPNNESNWMSANGLIAGDSQDGLLDPLTGGWEIRGVLWKDGNIIDLGTLECGYESLARGVNSAGEVAGLSTTLVPDPNAMIFYFGLPFPFQTRAFRWKNGVLRDLGTLGGPDTIAVAVNESGQIIGDSYTSSDPSPVCAQINFPLTTGAFLWEKGKMVNLGSLGGTCTNASALNNRGQVVGFSFLAGDEVFHPFRWERGKLRDLGTLGGNSGFANTLNEAGDAVGWQFIPGNDNIFHATLWSRGRITDLGALGVNQCSEAFSINSKKQVVGTSVNCDFEEATFRAFLWEPGGPMIDLNTLIPANAGVQLRNVATINERGEMAVVGSFPNGDHRPVLLIPCDGDSEGCQDADQNENASPRRPASSLAAASATRPKLSPKEMLARIHSQMGRRYHVHGLRVSAIH